MAVAINERVWRLSKNVARNVGRRVPIGIKEPSAAVMSSLENPNRGVVWKTGAALSSVPVILGELFVATTVGAARGFARGAERVTRRHV